MRYTRFTFPIVVSWVFLAACGSPAVWEGPDGAVTEEPGSSHCDEDGVPFLRVNEERFANDPNDALFNHGAVESAFERNTTLPSDAVDTALRDGDRHLWIAADASAVFVADGDTVDKWPRVEENYGCD